MSSPGDHDYYWLSACRNLLHVDDDEDDRLLVRYAISNSGLPLKYHSTQDGEEALRYLAGEGQYAARHLYPYPDVLVLDLKMPKLDGFGVLEALQNDGTLATLPVMVLSSSGFEEDWARARQLGASVCITKQTGFKRLVDELGQLFEFTREVENSGR